jgi:uncharacterized membrane protein
MNSLIHASDTFTLWAVILTGTALAIWTEQTFRWGAKLTAPVLALGLAMILSNLGIMPADSPVYDFVGAYLVPLAIPLLLFRASVVHIARRAGVVFLVFHISSLGTILGAFLATALLRGRVPQVEHAAGIMTGSYIGGAINFFAIKESFRVPETITNPLLVADNFVMALLFLLLLGIATHRFFLRSYPHPHSSSADAETARNRAAEHWRRKDIGLLDLAQSLAVAFLVVALAELVGRWIKGQFAVSPDSSPWLQMLHVMATNRYVLITSASLAVATLWHSRLSRIHGPEEIGGYLLYVFLFVIGLPADLKAVLFNVPMFFLFCAIMAGTNLVFTLAVGRLLRLNLEELLLCVNATVGGPPSAAAMAISMGWSNLVLPAILVGIWGYVIGTPLGILLAEILLRW